MIRLVLVEDESLVRLGLKQLLGFDARFEVVADATDGVAGLEVIERVMPDLVLMDVRMPGLSGIGVLKALREKGNSVPVILITTFDDEEAFLQAMHAGASAFLRKDISLEDLAAAIESAVAGERTIRPALLRNSQNQSFERKEPTKMTEALTKREVEVLRMMATGLSNKEIAESLFAGEATIKSHASSILAKLGARDRTRAILKGLELGLI